MNIMDIKINLNEFVKVKLTDFAKDIYYHQYDDLNEIIIKKGETPITPKMPKIDRDGYTKIQLWELMQIYGKYMKLGGTTCFKPLEIIYELEERQK